MKGEQQIDGKWWIHGTESPPVFGTIDISKKGPLRLLARIPSTRSIFEVVESLAHSNRASVSQVIVGRDQNDKPVTLFGCGCSDYRLCMGIETYEIDAMAVLRDIEISSWSQKAIRAVGIKGRAIHRWLSQKVVEEDILPDGKFSWKLPEFTDLVWNICPDFRLRISRQLTSDISVDDFKVRHQYPIYLEFQEPKSLQEITDKWIPWTTRLLSLLVGDKVNYDEIECSPKEPFETGTRRMFEGGSLIREGVKSGACPHAMDMLAPYEMIKDEFGDILKRWYEVSDRFEPVVDLFSTVEFHSSLHDEAQFLFLVQALEVYHVRSKHFQSAVLPTEEHTNRVETILSSAPEELKQWLKSRIQSSNYKPLNKRLEEIFQHHAKESSQLFQEDFADLAEKIRYTRNHLTHYNGKPSDPRFLSEEGMFRVNFSLRASIWALLLKELGISGNAIQKLLRRHRGMRFVMLSDCGQETIA